MYRYSNGQISLSDFQQPMGMRLREDNRWVKKAQSIPWDKIEKKYADLFPSETGNVAKPLQLALGACLIQREYGYSDVETVLQIQENPYLQYFCGYAGYDDSKLPFDASSMVHFRKRLTPEVLAQINEMVIQEAQKTEDNDNQDDNKPDGGGNSGTIIVDATCAPSNIRYPQDVSLLNEARENAEKLLDILHSPTDGKKPRTYRKRARKDYLKYVRCRKHTAKMTRKAIGKQLNYLKRDLAAIDGKLNQEKALNIHQTERLETIRKIYEQQKYMYDNHTHSVENRIVSVSQPFVRPIVRGKVGKPVEFGMKLDISVTDGWTRLEYRSFDAYNEATKLQEMIENFHKREGHYPSRVLADKIYRNRENLSYCKARGIRLSGPALGRPQKGEDRNKAQDYRDECERVEVERKFSLGKRKCGMGLVTAKLEETAAHVVALSILLLNLRKIQCAFLQFLDWLLGLLQSREKRMVIQWTLFMLQGDSHAARLMRSFAPFRQQNPNFRHQQHQHEQYLAEQPIGAAYLRNRGNAQNRQKGKHEQHIPDNSCKFQITVIARAEFQYRQHGKGKQQHADGNAVQRVCIDHAVFCAEIHENQSRRRDAEAQQAHNRHHQLIKCFHVFLPSSAFSASSRYSH